jgi:hypothetical protein
VKKGRLAECALPGVGKSCRTRLCTPRRRASTKPFGRSTKPLLAGDAVTRKRIARQHGPIDQTGGFDHVGNYLFDVSGILLRTPVGNAKESPPRKPRIRQRRGPHMPTGAYLEASRFRIDFWLIFLFCCGLFFFAARYRGGLFCYIIIDASCGWRAKYACKEK